MLPVLIKTYLITGCAGFIGSNFVYYMLGKYTDILLVNLDKLTYAGNLENLKGVEGDPRHVFVQGDICDKELVAGLIAKYDPDYMINFAAESHVDRSIANPEIFVETNVMGTVNLLQRAKEAWYDAEKKTWKEGKKYIQVGLWKRCIRAGKSSEKCFKRIGICKRKDLVNGLLYGVAKIRQNP